MKMRFPCKISESAISNRKIFVLFLICWCLPYIVPAFTMAHGDGGGFQPVMSGTISRMSVSTKAASLPVGPARRVVPIVLVCLPAQHVNTVRMVVVRAVAADARPALMASVQTIVAIARNVRTAIASTPAAVVRFAQTASV